MRAHKRAFSRRADSRCITPSSSSLLQRNYPPVSRCLARIGELLANDGLIVFNNLGHIIDETIKLKGMRSYLRENLAEKTDVVLKKVIATV